MIFFIEKYYESKLCVSCNEFIKPARSCWYREVNLLPAGTGGLCFTLGIEQFYKLCPTNLKSWLIDKNLRNANIAGKWEDQYAHSQVGVDRKPGRNGMDSEDRCQANAGTRTQGERKPLLRGPGSGEEKQCHFDKNAHVTHWVPVYWWRDHLHPSTPKELTLWLNL